MLIEIVSIFPGYLAPLELALVGKARARGLLEVRVHDLRDYTDDAHRTVDDTPFGGGGGMVMRPEPWGRALADLTARSGRPWVVVPTPAGRPFDQRAAQALAARPHLLFACGRYEGIDQRVLDTWSDEEISLGDYVLAGGEAAALVIVEAVTRLLPGVVGNAVSISEDSFSGPDGLLEGPVYTRPAVWDGRRVPDVLLSGDHAAVSAWRAEQSHARTRERRPDLLERRVGRSRAGLRDGP